MELLIILAVVAALALGAVGVALALRRAPGADLAGRLDQISVDHAAAQAQLAERLQNQERALGKALEERLARIDKRMGDGLDKTAKRTHETMIDLRERLAKIDEAQKNITELSVQMVGLQDILSNKQARGAFGEIQLNDLVSSILPPSAYSFQAQLSNKRMADCLLTLPNPPGPIVIDAKFPLESYHKLHASKSESEQKQ
ncbi:MAG: DNA recombination protein RmuC, partial [Alphaproteobacteria bacterium]